MYRVCLRVNRVGVGGMRVVFFQRSCHGSGAIAGCWGMLAALGSAEAARCHHPTDGALLQPPWQNHLARAALELLLDSMQLKSQRSETLCNGSHL